MDLQKRPRVLLDTAKALEIYRYKMALLVPDSFKSCIQKIEVKMKGHSTRLARKYGVSSKAIRDIWNRKSWINATVQLWLDEDRGFCIPNSLVRIVRY